MPLEISEYSLEAHTDRYIYVNHTTLKPINHYK